MHNIVCMHNYSYVYPFHIDFLSIQMDTNKCLVQNNGPHFHMVKYIGLRRNVEFDIIIILSFCGSLPSCKELTLLTLCTIPSFSTFACIWTNTFSMATAIPFTYCCKEYTMCAGILQGPIYI